MGIFKNTQVRAGEDIYRDSFYMAGAGLCLLTHPDFEMYDLNDSFANIFGFEKDEVKGSLFAVVWKKCDERDSFFTDIIRTGKSAPKETVVLRPDDSGKRVVISGVMLSDELILITVFEG